jgi:muconolactone delta-isomerase
MVKMLFHVTLRHNPEECPGRNPDKARASRVYFANREARQRELGYQVRVFVGAWPSHLEYALIEAPDLATVHRWIGTFPNQDKATVISVGQMADLINQDQANQPETSDRTDPPGSAGMLFHLTMEHSLQHCPSRNPDLIRGLQERYTQREQRSKETGVRVHFFVSAEPSHITYALLEADSVECVRRWLMRYPVPQDVTVTPVQRMANLLSSG